MTRRQFLTALILFCLLLAGTFAQGQGVGSSGNITGTVVDTTKAVLPNATVTVVEPATGLKRTATTDEHGWFRVAGLAPGTYNVTAQLSGFGTGTYTGVVVAVGQSVITDFTLKLSSVETVVEVAVERPLVETTRSSQADRITQNDINGLPIDRRDYLTFTLLAPGVSDSTRVAGDQDFRVKQTPQSGLSFYGSNGRGNSITVDGGETSDDAGGVRTTVSQDAVREFQINRSNYNAELGSATGASINIVTKSGTNKVHGSVYGFFRNDAMDASSPFSFGQALPAGQAFNPANPDSVAAHVKDSLSRQQWGGDIGFPLKKDRTFVFAAFENLRQDAQSAVPLLTNTNIFRPTTAQNAIIAALSSRGTATVPCLPDSAHPGQYVLLPAATCGFALNSILTVNPNPGANPFVSPFEGAMNAYLLSQFEGQGGIFPFNTRQYLSSVRFDHRFNDSNQISATYRYGNDLEESPDLHSLTAFTAGSSIHVHDHNLQGGWYHQFSASTQNELRAQWNYHNLDVVPNVPGQVGMQIPGFINNMGTNIFLPNYTTLHRYEFTDNFTTIRGQHTFKFGGTFLLRGNDTEAHTFLPGRFIFGSLPGGVLSPCLQVPAACGLSGAATVINPLQSAALGLPQVYQQGFGDPKYPYFRRPLTGLYFQDSWVMASRFTLNYGIRYELDSQFLPLTTYKKDFAPRLSFAWDLLGDHKTVIRGGYGIFYGPIDTQIPDVLMSMGVLNGDRSATENAGSGSQVSNLVSTCGISIAGGIPLVPAGGNSPCAREMSIYISPITATGIPGLQTAPVIFQTLFAQGLIQCTTPGAGSAACLTPAAISPLGLRIANSGPISPLQVIFVNQPGYRPPIAQQVSFGIEHEFSAGFSMSLSGIYSHTQHLPVAIDTNLLPAPMATVTLANGQKVSYRNWNKSASTDPLGGVEGLPCATTQCQVNPLVLQNNQYSSLASALYEGLIVEVKKRFSDRFSMFGNYTFSKAFDDTTDYNTDYGPQDPTNLGLDRSLSEFDERHKVSIAGIFDSPFHNSILSGFQLAPIFSYHAGHPFNLLAGGQVNGNNHTTNERPIGAARNTGLGPNFINLDARLTWKHKLTEKADLQLTAEAFNITNRTNYGSVNNEVGPLFGFQSGFTTFNVHGIKPGTKLADGSAATPSTPLAFTSALPKRQVQLGLRISF